MSQQFVNPNPVIRQQPNTSHSSGNGSFAPVFIVLAVIAVVSVVACVVGRLCSRQHHRDKEVLDHSKAKKPNHNLGPKQWESRQNSGFNMRENRDLEFGFENRNPNANPASSGGGKAVHPGPPPPHNGGHRPQVRFADNA